MYVLNEYKVVYKKKKKWLFSGEAAKMADESSMLAICDQIHIVLIKTDVTGETTLVSSHFLEWRPVLAVQRLQTMIELKGTGL